MPEVNVPAWVRFGLYLAAALALLVGQYLSAQGWVDDATSDLISGVAALANVLAASRVDLSRPPADAGDGEHRAT